MVWEVKGWKLSGIGNDDIGLFPNLIYLFDTFACILGDHWVYLSKG